jgi:hypothetical protein
MTDKHKYEALKEGTTYTLYKDGVQSFCPKLQPMPVQNQYTGGIDWTRFPCNTQCPFANIKKISSEEKDEYYYTIKCEGADIEHKLSPKSKDGSGSSKTDSTIIQL